jgi:hypothetical protein
LLRLAATNFISFLILAKIRASEDARANTRGAHSASAANELQALAGEKQKT